MVPNIDFEEDIRERRVILTRFCETPAISRDI
jgi:hypothetical protein